MWTGHNRLTSAVIGHEIDHETGKNVGFEAGKEHALRENR